MVARIVVAVLLSLAGAPVLQADSLSDYCHSIRLSAAAAEQWVKDVPENPDAVELAEWTGAKEDDPYCDRLGESAGFWLRSEMVVSNLSLVDGQVLLTRKYADPKQGIVLREMSVETLLLFAEAEIYAMRAFYGLLDELAERE